MCIRDRPRADARAMTERYPILGWGLLQTFGKRLMQVESHLEDVAYKKLPERLAALLLELADKNDAITGTSHQALADRLGTYRETVSAILRTCLLYTSPSPRDRTRSRMPSSA